MRCRPLPSRRVVLLWGLLTLGALSRAVAAATPEQLKEVTQELVCLCGTCNHESLTSCICGFAEEQRQDIGQALDAGQSKEQIIARLIDEYGSMVLAAPPAEGFNLVAWLTPFALLIFGVVVLRAVLVSWRRSQKSAPGDSESAATGQGQGDYADRLRRELDNYEAD